MQCSFLFIYFLELPESRNRKVAMPCQIFVTGSEKSLNGCFSQTFFVLRVMRGQEELPGTVGAAALLRHVQLHLITHF